MPVVETEEGSYILNSRDMCMIGHIPELLAAGVTSLKIEGRAKSAYYVSVVTNAYRAALKPRGSLCLPGFRRNWKKSVTENTAQAFIWAASPARRLEAEVMSALMKWWLCVKVGGRMA